MADWRDKVDSHEKAVWERNQRVLEEKAKQGVEDALRNRLSVARQYADHYGWRCAVCGKRPENYELDNMPVGRDEGQGVVPADGHSAFSGIAWHKCNQCGQWVCSDENCSYKRVCRRCATRL